MFNHPILYKILLLVFSCFNITYTYSETQQILNNSKAYNDSITKAFKNFELELATDLSIKYVDFAKKTKTMKVI